MISQGPHGLELPFLCEEYISPGNVYSGAVEGSEVMAEALAKILPGFSLCFLYSPLVRSHPLDARARP